MTHRLLLALVAGALLVAGCGDDEVEDRGEESPQNLTLQQIVERPPLPGETVAVTGEAKVLEDVGFQLSDDQNNAILVLGGADRVEDGAQASIIGTVDRISQPLATEIANALEGTPDVVARTSQGALYLQFVRLVER